MSSPNVSPGSAQPRGKGGGGTTGRADDAGSENTSHGGYMPWNYCAPPTASVVIRASVEHVGAVGETELTVNVKWPASAFCVQPCKKPAPPCDQPSDSQNVPGNGPESNNFGSVYGDVIPDLPPLTVRTPAPKEHPGAAATKETPEAAATKEHPGAAATKEHPGAAATKETPGATTSSTSPSVSRRERTR
jgi:hypothetical protein